MIAAVVIERRLNTSSPQSKNIYSEFSRRIVELMKFIGIVL